MGISRTIGNSIGMFIGVSILTTVGNLPTATYAAQNQSESGRAEVEESDRVVEKRVWSYVRPVGSVSGTRAYLGVEMVGMTPELLEHFGTPSEGGVLISKVHDESPARAAGIQVGDIVTAIDSKAVDSPARLAMEIMHRDQGDIVQLEVWRDGRLDSFEAVLDERDRPMIDIRRLHAGDHSEDFDVRVHHLEVPESLQDFTGIPSHIEIDPEVFHEAIERLHEELSETDLQQRIVRFSEHETGLRERLEELETRMQELERELEALPDER